ncbi:hypothetical protein BH09ACT7_BH09ACT7_17820 [soil metagenome]
MIWLSGATVYLVCEAVAAAGFPGYSYAANYISDLGVSPVMNVGAFMAHGTLFLLGAAVAVRCYPGTGLVGGAFVPAAAANALGNVLVGTFRSGMAPTSANWHLVGAALALVGGNVAVILAGIGGRRVGAPPAYVRASVGLGAVGLASQVALIINGASGFVPVGVLERGAVYSIIGWELMTGFAILCRRRPAGQRLTNSGSRGG